MTAPEYIQLKAYARQDGFYLALLWTTSFVCYILGITNQLLEMLALGLAVFTPFFVASRLRKFRDEGREGLISFRRSYAYTVFVFFYGAVLLAVVQFIYFAYLDHGYLLNSFSKMMSSDEGKQLISHYGMTQMMEENRNAVNKDLPQYSQISAIELVASEFEKTPKRSIKRYLYK